MGALLILRARSRSRRTRGASLVEALGVLAVIALGGLVALRAISTSERGTADRVGQAILSFDAVGGDGARGSGSLPAPGRVDAPAAIALRAAPLVRAGLFAPDETPAGDEPSVEKDDSTYVDPTDLEPPDDSDIHPTEHHWYDGPLNVATGVASAAWNRAAQTGQYAVNFLKAAAPHAPEIAANTAMMAGGVAIAMLGAGGEVGGFALDLTVVGAAVGVPVNVVSAGIIASGLAMAAIGGKGLGDELSEAASETERPTQPADDTPPDPRASSPVRIPDEAEVVQQEKTGYEQVRYRWTEGSERYEARWHTRTPGAPEDQGNTWVVTKTEPGTPTGQPRRDYVLTGENQWTSMQTWQDAVKARQAGTATPEQQALLDGGHWPAPP